VSDISQGHEHPSFLIPEPETDTGEACPKSDRLDPAEKVQIVVAFFEEVIRDPRAQMMDMMETDVSAEPLEDPRQGVVGASPGRLFEIGPVRVAIPLNPFILVLNVEHPQSGDAGDGDDRQLNEHEGLETDCEMSEHEDSQKRQVIIDDAPFHSRSGALRPETIENQEEIEWACAEQGQGDAGRFDT